MEAVFSKIHLRKRTKYEQNLPTLTDTSLPLNQSCRLAQERGAVGRNGFSLAIEEESVPSGFINSFLLYVVGCNHT